MSDGIERAAQRIYDNHADVGGVAQNDARDARVILDATKQAIERMEAIRELHAGSKGTTWEFAVTALACLQGDEQEPPIRSEVVTQAQVDDMNRLLSLPIREGFSVDLDDESDDA